VLPEPLLKTLEFAILSLLVSKLFFVLLHFNCKKAKAFEFDIFKLNFIILINQFHKAGHDIRLISTINRDSKIYLLLFVPPFKFIPL
jgi:hypothetical protein